MEIIDNGLDGKYDLLTFGRIRDKLLAKVDQMNKQSGQRTSREAEKSLYVKYQNKGTCTNYKRYRHKGNTVVIKKAQTYQHFITATNPKI